ncbi:uncharacterized protein TM35_000381360 [Trypanosoma theileri]|uniref:Vacuolar protein sorting-associated protein VTA1 n=1 Tax=Trypanosoma theileri TaxID=67003 RepID=A0A1X0NKE3_9TRYP|nr:uncharacterized protein TM35_000381360 [Trypanosoma theileri]ORC85061.1 hypothetical protein TM35_000381360 [Trypanosoma theileri]
MNNTNNNNNNNNNSSSSASLAEGIPAAWVSTLRPFLQRADEFDSRVPVVAYFLRTHAAFLAMQLHKQQKSTAAAGSNSNSNSNSDLHINNNNNNTAGCKQYLLRLLNALEQQKQQLAEALTGVDGRTILTRYALMLFAQADDAERSGAGASLRLIQLFFTASILFDATAQFTPDGCVDSVAAEKRNYARYIAIRMKKALDTGTPYVSPNKNEHTFEEEEGEEGGNLHNEEDPSPPPPPPPYHYNNNNNNNNNNKEAGGYKTQPFQHHQYQSSPVVSPPPPPVVTTTTPPPPSYSSLPPSSSTHTPQNNWKANTNTTVNSNSNSNKSGIGSGSAPSIEAMITAQKYCKQAVSALQFYDHASARQQLLSALDALDGKLKK